MNEWHPWEVPGESESATGSFSFEIVVSSWPYKLTPAGRRYRLTKHQADVLAAVAGLFCIPGGTAREIQRALKVLVKRGLIRHRGCECYPTPAGRAAVAEVCDG